jgi:multimeric flavodoxin WrbA
VKTLVLYGSSRRGGNSETLANHLTQGLDCTRIYLAEQRVTPIVDQRHDPAGFAPVADDQDAIVRQMLAHDLIVFATPLYWYGMSGQMKLFVDRWSQSLRDPAVDFKGGMAGKKAAVVIAGGSDARIKGLPLVQQFQYIFDFMSMQFAGYVIGRSGKPGDILNDERALEEAAALRRELS